jgi:hypothetical protein
MTPRNSTDLEPWQLAIGAVRRVWERREDWLRLAVAPVIATFALNIWFQPYAETFFGALQPGREPDMAQLASVQGPTFLFWAVNWLVIAVFVVNWMRALALGNAAAPGLGLHFRRHHLRMWLSLLLFQVAMFLAFMAGISLVLLIAPSVAIVLAAATIFAIWILIVAVRLTPFWIGIAIDAPMRPRDAWQRTSGQGIRLAVAFIMVSFGLFFMQSLFLSLSFNLGVIDAAPLALSFVSVVIQFVMFAAIGAVFVHAYPRFVSETV